MPTDDRDSKFERALAQHLRAGSAAGCPDAETLAAYHERSLSLEEMAQWKQHIAGCALCQEALALVEATEKQLAEEWQGEDVPVMQAARLQESRAASRAPRRAAAGEEETPSATGAPVAMAARRRPPLLRWAIPLGAVAAGVLVWIGIHEQRALQAPQSGGIQMAKNQPAAAPEERMDESPRKAEPITPAVAPPASSSAQVATPEARAKDAGGTKKEQAERSADMLLDKTAPAHVSGNAPALQRLPAGAAETVEVQSAPPAPAPVPAAGDKIAGRAAGAQVAESDAKSAAPSTRQKSAAPQQMANDVNTNALAEKQGDLSQAVLAGARTSGFIFTPDNQVMWRLGASGTVQLTTDGGAKWKTLKTGASNTLTAGSAPSSRVCWIAGKAGTLVLTTDRGSHWTVIATPITGDLGGVHASDGKHASIWDAVNNKSYETPDGGATWKQVADQ